MQNTTEQPYMWIFTPPSPRKIRRSRRGGNSINLIEPFWAKNDTSRIFKEKPVKLTLSPKDPAFPAWWEQHKSEWEA